MNLKTIDYRLVRSLAPPRIKDPGDAYLLWSETKCRKARNLLRQQAAPARCYLGGMNLADAKAVAMMLQESATFA